MFVPYIVSVSDVFNMNGDTNDNVLKDDNFVYDTNPCNVYTKGGLYIHSKYGDS